MSSAERVPLDHGRLAADPTWRYDVLATSPSTNAEAAARYRAGEDPGLVVVAEHQTAGRGRMDRVWETPDRAALTVSFVVDPGIEVGSWPWLPLLTGIAAAEAVRRSAGVDAELKWPNDVLVGDRKLAGILAERVERPGAAAAVIGIGINVSQERAELPIEAATSLALEGGDTDRTGLLLALGEELAGWVTGWVAGTRDLRAAYLQRCRTVGQRVRADEPGGAAIEGDAVDVAEDGRLVVRTGAGERRLGTGDVFHVRPIL
jgi:BirA family biotin operon repressor/biotin-[acetyl-CoA-carboxylase] ligase